MEAGIGPLKAHHGGTLKVFYLNLYCGIFDHTVGPEFVLNKPLGREVESATSGQEVALEN